MSHFQSSERVAYKALWQKMPRRAQCRYDARALRLDNGKWLDVAPFESQELHETSDREDYATEGSAAYPSMRCHVDDGSLTVLTCADYSSSIWKIREAVRVVLEDLLLLIREISPECRVNERICLIASPFVQHSMTDSLLNHLCAPCWQFLISNLPPCGAVVMLS